MIPRSGTSPGTLISTAIVLPVTPRPRLGPALLRPRASWGSAAAHFIHPLYNLLIAIAITTLTPSITTALLAVAPPGALQLPSLIPPEFIHLGHLRKARSASSVGRYFLNFVILQRYLVQGITMTGIK